MDKRRIPESEFIINADGTVFHLHLLPEQLADKIVMMGDPARVDMVADFFDTIECNISSREFHTITGFYKGKRITAMSHGIGGDNIDIVMSELDALVNVDFATRTVKDEKKSLTIVRIGTSGGLQPDIELGTNLISVRSMGFDGVLNFYANRNSVCDLAFEEAFCKAVEWNSNHASPYIVSADEELVGRLNQGDMQEGVTISANGFYGPQGRVLRCDIAVKDINDRITDFHYEGQRITNYEMEGSAIAGLSLLMGHKAMTVCCVIAQRKVEAANTDYKPRIRQLVQTVLERI